ncbi:hypothetical protein OH786_02160 [Streptomyces atratus]|uniref:Uncharacterized protein n=1 Tax=Streptomyces atratus TaxID=1893 RepID=A0A1K1Y3P6_STRAR|nr:hypothetical protein [Streptomyces atratus]SFX56480.1 hypothetical protein SAMN02787144_100487 [Streptomyces atratus]
MYEDEHHIAFLDRYQAWSSTIGDQMATEHTLLAPPSGTGRDQLVVLLRKIALAAEPDGPPLMPGVD